MNKSEIFGLGVEFGKQIVFIQEIEEKISVVGPAEPAFHIIRIEKYISPLKPPVAYTISVIRQCNRYCSFQGIFTDLPVMLNCLLKQAFQALDILFKSPVKLVFGSKHRPALFIHG